MAFEASCIRRERFAFFAEPLRALRPISEAPGKAAECAKVPQRAQRSMAKTSAILVFFTRFN